MFQRRHSFDRKGKVMGIYRKLHSSSIPRQAPWNMTTPGKKEPVFECDSPSLGYRFATTWILITAGGNWPAGAELVACQANHRETSNLLSRQT